MRIAAMAAGAVGGYFGARMAAAGHDVFFIARGANLEAIKKNGLKIESVHGDVHLPKPNVTDGPALVAAAAAVRTNNPAPMIAPIPSAISDPAPSVRFSPECSASAASASSAAIGFRAQRRSMCDRTAKRPLDAARAARYGSRRSVAELAGALLLVHQGIRLDQQRFDAFRLRRIVNRPTRACR